MLRSSPHLGFDSIHMQKYLATNTCWSGSLVIRILTSAILALDWWVPININWHLGTLRLNLLITKQYLTLHKSQLILESNWVKTLVLRLSVLQCWLQTCLYCIIHWRLWPVHLSKRRRAVALKPTLEASQYWLAIDQIGPVTLIDIYQRDISKIIYFMCSKSQNFAA